MVGTFMDVNVYTAGIFMGMATRCPECWEEEKLAGNTAEDMPHYSMSQEQAARTPPTSTTPEMPHRPPE